MKPLGLLITGDPVESAAQARGDFAEMFKVALADSWSGSFWEADARLVDDYPRPAEIGGLIISGSPASVTERAPWMLRAEQFLRDAVRARVPILGVCLGHQLLAQALGGEVAPNRYGREMGTVLLDVHESDSLLEREGSFAVNASHVDSIVVLPPGARRIASTAREPNAVVRFAPQVWGVQFHPEFDADIVRHYVRTREATIRAEGLEPEAILAQVQDATESRALLRRFAGIVAASQ